MQKYNSKARFDRSYDCRGQFEAEACGFDSPAGCINVFSLNFSLASLYSKFSKAHANEIEYNMLSEVICAVDFIKLFYRLPLKGRPVSVFGRAR